MEILVIPLKKVSVLIAIGISDAFSTGISIMKYIRYEMEKQLNRKFSIYVCT